MRVISGNLKGKIIQNSTDKNTRPLRDMVRESIFNILEHSKNQKIEFKKGIILDLFSGSGSFGIECLSRGVKKVYFIENYKPSLKVLRKNLNDLKLNRNSVIIEKNVYEISYENINDKNIDLIYLDPPFKDKNINKLLEKIKNFKLAQSNTSIIIHRNKKYKDEFIKEFKIFREQSYGISKIIFGKILF
tara:strand:- start:3 stop:569 length:567 start_codon:yes stop_codon:yes gene_type:complete